MGPAPPRSSRKYYYCFRTNHLFLNCMVKNENKQKGVILVDGFTVRFTNGDPIPMDPNLSIRECVKKHLLSLVVVMLISDPDPELVEFLDREPDIGYNQSILSKTILKGLQASPFKREQLQPEVV